MYVFLVQLILVKENYRIFLGVLLITLSSFGLGIWVEPGTSNPAKEFIEFKIDPDTKFQTIHNFGASDAWSIQFVGKNWPLESRERISDLLFSIDNKSDGSPKGIGLSAWRFNIGGGSAEQGSLSQIKDEWRRAECFLDETGKLDWTKQEGQQWFLKAAKERGVDNFIGFVNSPPVSLTKNGKAWSQDGSSTNLKEGHYGTFADFLVKVVKGIEVNTGVTFDYVSPFNEPQWKWNCCGQEGSPWNNNEIAQVTRVINQAFNIAKLTHTKIEITEAGQIDYLYDDTKEPNHRTNQIAEFFAPISTNYLGDLEFVAPKISGHSYFTTWDLPRLRNSRIALQSNISSIDPNLEYWMTEYTILEDNEEIKGPGQDLGIIPALYMARVIQADMLFAKASAWHWWLAVSPYDYKDGLVYIDWNKNEGQIHESKMLWALGHFSRFIRPGSIRIGIDQTDGSTAEESLDGIMTSAYQTPTGEIVVVFLNQRMVDEEVKISGLIGADLRNHTYLTSAKPMDNLRYTGDNAIDKTLRIPGKSIVTCLIK